MYIPGWLIFIALCLIFIIYVKKRTHKSGYYGHNKKVFLSKRQLQQFQENYTLDIPLDEDSKHYNYFTQKCYEQIYYTHSAEKQFTALKKYADDLKLYDRISTFLDDVQDYHRYYKDNLRQYGRIKFTSWRSNTITPFNLPKTKKYFETKPLQAISKQVFFDKEDEILEFNFRYNDGEGILYLGPPQREFNIYSPLIIMEDKEESPQVFLVAKLYR